MKTEKLLISRNTKVIELETQKAVEVVPDMQRVIDEGKAAELEITNDNLLEVCRDPEAFAKAAYEATIDKVPVLQGRKMSKQAILDSYEFPDTTMFVQAVNVFKSKVNQVQKQFLHVVDGKAMINEDEVNAFIDKCSRYLTNPEAIELWNSYNGMVDVMNKFRALVLEKHGRVMGLNNLRDFLDNNGDEIIVRLSTFDQLTARYNS